MKTLADLTPEQREACPGLWCDYVPFPWEDEPRTREFGVIHSFTTDGQVVVAPTRGNRDGLTYSYCALDCITPRFDLPRAWGAYGQPVPMFVEYGGDEWDQDREEPFHWPLDDNNSCCQDVERTHRRFVTKWEKCQ